jgi:bile acid-coenzyme A ligase
VQEEGVVASWQDAAMATSPPTTAGPVSYGERIRQLARLHPDGRAVLFAAADGRDVTVTWAELDRRTNQVGRLLADHGVGVDDLVVVGVHNSVEHILATFGAWKIGACVLPLRWDLPAWEREKLLELADPALCVAAWDDTSRAVITPGAVAAGDGLDDGALPDIVPPRAGGIASSGSTGRPKIIINPQPGEIDVSTVVRMTGVASQLQLIPAPLYHTNGFSMYRTILLDEPVVLMEKFDAARFVDLVERYRVNMFIAVPTMLQRIARLPGVRERDWSSVLAVQQGGAPIPDWLVEFWLDLVGPERFFMSYGSTERVGLCIIRGDQWLTHRGSVGPGHDGTEIRIVGEDGAELPVGEVGEIFMRKLDDAGPTFAYVGADAPPSTDDGFTSIGDLGRLDEDGYLYIADRRVDLILTGGANVFPAEVEAALSEHPGVHDAVVVGLPDEEWGRRVHAIVEPDPSGPAPTAAELDAWCRDRLAPYKRPKSIELVERLPRSEAGKINRGKLLAERSPATEGEA